MKQFSLYFMCYSQGKFLGNMLAMQNKEWYDRVSELPTKLKDWLHYEIDDRLDYVPYRVYHEIQIPKCIEIIPNLDSVKILQQSKDSSNRSWEKFLISDVNNWRRAEDPIYTLHQDDLRYWNKTHHHLVECSSLLNLSINYKLARMYFDVYWQAHNHLFSN